MPRPLPFTPYVLFPVPEVEPPQDSHSRKMVLIKTIETRDGEVRWDTWDQDPIVSILFLSPSLAAADLRVLWVSGSWGGRETGR